MKTNKERFEDYKKSQGFKTLQGMLDTELQRNGLELQDLSKTKDFDDLYETLEGENAIWTPELAAIASLIEGLAATTDTPKKKEYTFDDLEEKQGMLLEKLQTTLHYKGPGYGTQCQIAEVRNTFLPDDESSIHTIIYREKIGTFDLNDDKYYEHASEMAGELAGIMESQTMIETKEGHTLTYQFSDEHHIITLFNSGRN